MRIAFGYKMGTGKDTAVSYLMSKYGGKQICFASPIYDIMYYAQERCGFPIEKDRQFLQYIGTEWGRSREENVWVRLAIEATPPPSENAFLSDLRFPNEFKALKEKDWVCVKLVRDQQEDRKGSGSHAHSSENALDSIPDEEWDFVITNNGTIAEFERNLDRLVRKIFKCLQ